MAYKASLSEVRKKLRHAGHASGHEAHAPEEKAFVSYFVPMGRGHGSEIMNCGDKRVPVHTTDVIRRGDLLWENLDSSMRSGNFAAIYKAYLLAVFFFVATLVTAFFNAYVAGVCAFLAGYFWSERLLNSAWGIAWYKGKSMVYTV